MHFLTSRPYLIAIMIAGGVFFWMKNSVQPAPTLQPAIKKERPLQRVEITPIRAQTLVRELQFTGVTEPARVSQVAAEVAGTVVRVGAERGSSVRRGSMILQIDQGNINPDLKSANAELARIQRDFDAQKSLVDRGLAARNSINALQAQLSAAEAQVSRFQRSLGNTSVDAPFSGFLADRLVELGDYVNPGQAVAELLLLDTLIITGSVSERDIAKVRLGQSGYVVLTDGSQLGGVVRYIAPRSDAATRTFKVELEIPNDQQKLRGGMTTDVQIEYAKIQAHKLSPALVSLDNAGYPGVHAVDQDAKVVFYRAEILEADPDGIWLGNLPDQLNLITQGQGFVRAGEEVIAVVSETEER